MNALLKELINKGLYLVSQPYKKIEFSNNEESDNLLNDLKRYPHAFVIGCLMDRQIKAERAWLIPYKINKILNGFKMRDLYQLKLTEVIEIYRTNKLHRFNDEMAKIFYLAIEKIYYKYGGNASKIWENKPSSASIVRKFLEFHGCGPKIASMATNTLHREFKIPMKDYYSIDISPDRHVNKVFKRIGFVEKKAKRETIVYLARELYPEYPGIFDLSCYEIGVKWCKSKNPICENCHLFQLCPRHI